MRWHMASRADGEARELADRHYNRQKPGTPQFVPPGRCLVLKIPRQAFWVTSWPFAQYVKHRWGGAWVCSAFRNEGPDVSSELICEAVAATRWFYGDPPEQGMVTFLDRTKVRPIKVRGVHTWGRTWRLAGFEDDGETQGGLLALVLRPCRMIDVRAPLGAGFPHHSVTDILGI